MCNPMDCIGRGTGSCLKIKVKMFEKRKERVLKNWKIMLLKIFAEKVVIFKKP
jgi:hypothetical protein